MVGLHRNTWYSALYTVGAQYMLVSFPPFLLSSSRTTIPFLKPCCPPPKLIYIWPLGPEDKTPRCGTDVTCPCQDRISNGRGGRGRRKNYLCRKGAYSPIQTLLRRQDSSSRINHLLWFRNLSPLSALYHPPLPQGKSLSSPFFSFTLYIMANGYRIRAGVPNLCAMDM